MGNRGRIIKSAMIILALLIGIFLMYFGISGTIKLNGNSKNFEKVEGYLIDYSLYSEGEYDRADGSSTNDTYTLIYKYVVNGQEYTLSTEYGTGIIPEKGSVQEIRYNPKNPNEAIIVGFNSNHYLIFAGFFFIAVPLHMVLNYLFSIGWFKKVPSELMAAWTGLYFIVIGCGVMYLATGQNSIKGVIEHLFSSFHLILLVPILFIVLGTYFIIRSLFSTGKQILNKRENINF